MRVCIDFHDLSFGRSTDSRTDFALTLRKGYAFVFIQKILLLIRRHPWAERDASSQASLCSHVSLDKGRYMLCGPSYFGYHVRAPDKVMPHPRPDLQLHLHSGGFEPIHHTGGVAKQGLLVIMYPFSFTSPHAAGSSHVNGATSRIDKNQLRLFLDPVDGKQFVDTCLLPADAHGFKEALSFLM